jgi:hypothetical protein
MLESHELEQHFATLKKLFYIKNFLKKCRMKLRMGIFFCEWANKVLLVSYLLVSTQQKNLVTLIIRL